MIIKVNCKYNDQGAWCTNKEIKRSLFGLGARCCVEFDSSNTCSLKQPYRKTVPPPMAIKKQRKNETL
ncbi:MAG: hypothetical protein ACOCVF_01115 [bacterium]